MMFIIFVTSLLVLSKTTALKVFNATGFTQIPLVGANLLSEPKAVISKLECGSQCKSYPSCEVFQFEPVTKNCSFGAPSIWDWNPTTAETSSLIAQPLVNAYTFMNGQIEVGESSIENTTCPSQNILVGSTTVPDVPTCLSTCSTTDFCRMYVYKPASQLCMMFYECLEIQCSTCAEGWEWSRNENRFVKIPRTGWIVTSSGALNTGNWKAENLIDDVIGNGGHFYHSNNHQLDWWQADFGSTVSNIAGVEIRKGGTRVNESLRFQVRIGDTDVGNHGKTQININTVCGAHAKTNVGEILPFILCKEPLSGRYLTIQGQGERLMLDDLQVLILGT